MFGTQQLDSPTDRFVEKFNDPSQWVIVRGVPVFDEHSEEGEETVVDPATGKNVKRKTVDHFDRAELETHAANCNSLVESGNPPGLTLGHTKDDADEKSQPETVGFGKNYRVAYSRQLGRNVILHDEWYMPDRMADVKTMPYRSVERYKAAKIFKPIALLRREPRRNLGVVTYRRGPDTVVRYSMHEVNAMDPEQKPEVAAPEVPAAPAAPEAAALAAPEAALEPSPKDRELFAKLIDSYMADPGNCEKMKKYFAGGGEEEPAAPLAEPPVQNSAVPSASNVAPPTLPEPDKNAANSEVVRYQAQLQEASNRIAALEKESRVERYSAALDQLDREGIRFNKAEELAEIQDYPAEKANGYFAKMRKNYSRLPLDGHGQLRLANLPDPTDDGKTSRIGSKEEMEKVLRYQADHPGTSITEAKEKALRA